MPLDLFVLPLPISSGRVYWSFIGGGVVSAELYILSYSSGTSDDPEAAGDTEELSLSPCLISSAPRVSWLILTRTDAASSN